MDEKQLQAALESGVSVAKGLAVSLRSIAVVQLAGEFYTRKERAELIAEYAELKHVEQQAYEHHRAFKLTHGDLDPEERVRLMGKAAAQSEDRARRVQWETAQHFAEARKTLAKDHPLIAALVEAADAVSVS